MLLKQSSSYQGKFELGEEKLAQVSGKFGLVGFNCTNDLHLHSRAESQQADIPLLRTFWPAGLICEQCRTSDSWAYKRTEGYG